MAAGVAGSAPLAACGSGGSAYARAVTQTWRPFDTGITERVALQHELVRYATLAPSSHNTQCWKFTLDEDRIWIGPDLARRCPAVDPDDHHLFVSLGCATENLVQAGLARGWYSEVRFDPAGAGAVRIDLEAGRPMRSALFDAIPARQSTRNEYDGQSLTLEQLRALEIAGTGNGVRVILLTDRTQIESVLEYVTSANTVQMHDPAFMAELRHWIRFDDAQAVATRDGLLSRASGNPALPPELGGLAMRLFFTPQTENDKYAKFIRSSAGIAVFVSDTSGKQHWIEAGRCYERFALQATLMDVRTAMINAPIEVTALRPAFASWLGVSGRRPDLVVRFGKGPLMPRSLRRDINDVIT